ncbi:MAG: TIM barrel protein [Candidatus Thorarchaeota archaeon]
MSFITGLSIQQVKNILPSDWIRIATAIRLRHIEFDQTVFNDIENVLKVLEAPQTVIHAPYMEDYGTDLSTNKQEVDHFVNNVLTFQKELNIIGVVVHPPTDAGGSWELFYDRLEKLPLPLLENMPYQSWREFEDFVVTTQANVNRNVGMCFDIPHSWITHGESFLELPEFCMNFLRESTGYIHISGGTREEDTHFPLLTEGDMPFNPVEEFLKGIPFSGTVTMELGPRSLDDLNKIFQSYVLMLGIAGKRFHKLQVKVKRPFIMRKVRQLASKAGSDLL